MLATTLARRGAARSALQLLARRALCAAPTKQDGVSARPADSHDAAAPAARRRAHSVSGGADSLDYSFTSELKIERPESLPVRDAFQLLQRDGSLRGGAEEPAVSAELCARLYESMVRLQVMDGVLYEAQRQGRISFYMQTAGEEAATIGCAAALQAQDTVFSQYREHGVLLWRGFTMQQFADQCFSNSDDAGKGRQMPMHFGSRELNFQTISSPLTTQLPQAAGAAFALRDAGDAGPVVACFFGEGAASEGDFHAALNFASTLECPVLFICRNNQYAISTPVQDQFRGDGIVSRAAGYGMASLRVDGNDVLAVLRGVGEARALSRARCAPVLVELMSYRVGHHSTSDDSTAYRAVSEIESWRAGSNPVARFRAFLEARGRWDAAREETLRADARAEVLAAMKAAERKDKPAAMENLFSDVYDEVPPSLREQERELRAHVAKYPAHYTVL